MNILKKTKHRKCPLCDVELVHIKGATYVCPECGVRYEEADNADHIDPKYSKEVTR